MERLHELTGLEQAAAIARRELSPVELAEHYLARAGRHGDAVGAFVTLCPELALAQARRAEQAVLDGEPLGPLHGVPVPIKDLNAVAGVRCTFGSAPFRDHVPDADDRMARLLREAGTVMLGKTTTPEFGMTAWTESEVAPTARTPFDLERSASGSSGGAAAAVAAGLAPLAHGSDGGGSVRTPASACGLVGLKPSRGVLSGGPFEEVTGLASSGAIARTVRDAAALLDILAEPDPAASRPLPAHGAGYLAAAGRAHRRVRIGRFTTPPLTDCGIDPGVLEGFEATSRLLASLGHEIVDVAPPFTPAEAASFDAVWGVLGGLAPVPPGLEDQLSPITRWHRGRAAATSGVEFGRALMRLGAIAYGARARYRDVDAILSPTLALPPVPVGALRDDADPAHGFELEKAFSPYTSAWNVLGLPAVSLPLHEVRTPAGTRLPIGMMLAGRMGEDGALVALAAQLEAAQPWIDRLPVFA